MAQSPRPTGGSQTGTNAEHKSGCKRYEGQDRGNAGCRRRRRARNNGGHGRVDGVDETEPAVHEITGENEADYAGSDCNKKLQHIEFPE
jgi:hypothetical protein